MVLRLDKTTANAELSAELSRIGHLLANLLEDGRVIPPRTDGPIAQLARSLGLSAFETDVLAFAIGVQLNADIAGLSARIAGDGRATFASFGVAFAAFEAPEWAAVSPERPLRHMRLVEVTAPDRVLASEIRIDERLLHMLFGETLALDPRLRPYLHPVHVLPEPAEGLKKHARQMAMAIACNDTPAVIVTGRHPADIRIAAFHAAAERPIWRLALGDLPTGAVERETFARLWEREARLTGAVLLVEVDEVAASTALDHLLEGQPGPIFLSGRELSLPESTAPTLHVAAPDRGTQASLWRKSLGTRAMRLGPEIDALTQAFDLSEAKIAALAAQLPMHKATLKADLWEACRRSSRLRLGNLAQRVDAIAGWGDLILPDDALGTLRTLAAQVRYRHRVHEDWGFGKKSNRGFGITALFAGPSGTGKTMAAEVIATSLDLDLYRIDLSAVVSKYIGETEKNLRSLFDAAEGTGAILLFDEADALFGKRSEVSDAHDRYANIEVSYLLQRMEAYAGLAILTTNMRSALDDAFARRIRFTVTFPFPNYEARLRIWKGVFPMEAELGLLAWEKLAKLELSAGHIRNVAVNAAFLAAEASRPIEMSHLLTSAIIECSNLEKPVTPTEIAGWAS